MHVATRASPAHEKHTPPQCNLGSSYTSFDPYVAMLNQMSSLSLS